MVKVIFWMFLVSLSACAVKFNRGQGSGFSNSKTFLPSSGNSSKSDMKNRIQYEQNLKTKREKEQYSEILPLFHDESERVEFLSLTSVEERQSWIQSHQLLSRSAELYKKFKSVIEAQDISVGMTQDLVKKSWGEPHGMEASGNPIYKNERWRYTQNISTPEGFKKEDRWVYFESGRVVGWETKTN